MAFDRTIHRTLLRGGVPPKLAAGLAGARTVTTAETTAGMVYGGMPPVLAAQLAAGTLTTAEKVVAYMYMGLSGPDAVAMAAASVGYVPPVPVAGFTGSVKTGTSPATLTLGGNPPVGSAVLLALRQSFNVTFTPSGLGASWTNLGVSGTCGIWIGTGCDGSGPNISISWSGSTTLIASAQAFTNVVSAGAQYIGSASNVATIGPLTAGSTGGVAIATCATGTASTADLPSTWTNLAVGGDGGTRAAYIILTAGQTAQRTMGTVAANAMGLAAAG